MFSGASAISIVTRAQVSQAPVSKKQQQAATAAAAAAAAAGASRLASPVARRVGLRGGRSLVSGEPWVELDDTSYPPLPTSTSCFSTALPSHRPSQVKTWGAGVGGWWVGRRWGLRRRRVDGGVRGYGGGVWGGVGSALGCVCVCGGGGGFLGNGITTLSGHSGIEFAKVRNNPVVNNTEPFPLARR